MSPPMLPLEELAASMPFRGIVRLKEGRFSLRFDCRHVHERRYVLRRLLGIAYPQADVDSLLIELVIRPKDTCLDAGANIGVTAAEMLRNGARHVLAFEPEPGLARRLEALRPAGVDVHATALGDHDGEADLVLSEAHNQGHTLDAATVERFPMVFGPSPRQTSVPVTTLDTLASSGIAPCDIWKIDVEGNEGALLRGARVCLATAPPRAIICESWLKPNDLRALLGPEWTMWRACIRREPYGLELLQADLEPNSSRHHQIAPMFLIVRDDAVDAKLAKALRSVML